MAKHDPAHMPLVNSGVHCEPDRRYNMYKIKQPVMIIETNNGHTFFNQTHCHMCVHNEIDGLLIPMVHPLGMDARGRSFSFEHCEPQKKDVKSDLEYQPGITNVEIQSCNEAWVEFYAYFYGQPINGVVTWQNCD